MHDLAEFLQIQFPAFAKEITNIVFIVFLVLNILDDYDKIKNFCMRLLDVQKHIDKLFYTRKRNVYNQILSSDKFIDWQCKVIKMIYEPLVEIKKQKIDVNFTNLNIEGLQREYESITIRAKEVSYPFDSICPKNRLEVKEDIAIEKYPQLSKSNKKTAQKYYRLIKYTIKQPRRLGYMLDELSITSDGCTVSSYVGTYENNLKTSHVLEYELYQLYKKRINLNRISREELLKKLPIREAIHSNFSKEKDGEESAIEKEANILVSGKYRSSLLSVQIFVMIRNYSNSYDVLRIRRSSNVSAKANYLQFIPSGGFEAMNDCTDCDAQWDNYSIAKVLFRELLEECFGVDEDDKKISGSNVSPEKIYHNKHVKKLLEMIDSKELPKAQLEFLGTTMSLIGLRQELSFLLKVEDSSFAAELTGNYESKSAISMVDIRNLEKKNFWKLNKQASDLRMLNCTSAGLFELARKSKLYQAALQNVR